jgi:hypothetical protein
MGLCLLQQSRKAWIKEGLSGLDYPLLAQQAAT